MADLLTPVLYNGKLYVVAPEVQSFLPRNVYQIDASNGEIDWIETIEEISISMTGCITLVPDAFGPGEHGLYFNGDSGAANDGIPDVFGIKVSEKGAEPAWSAEGGKVARSHLIYSEETNTLYAHTWADYGGQLYTYDPVTGPLAVNRNPAGTGHGFYDVGCLDFNGTDIIAGGFEGMVIRYTDKGNGVTEAEIAFDDSMPAPTFWGEYRVYGQLLKAPNGHSVLISGTNSDTGVDPSYSARVVAIDITEGRLLWEFDTGVVQNHGFTVRGGPVAGPDGKIYYFDAVTGELVALKGPQISRPPQFMRGDANADGEVNIADAVSILSYLFGGGKTLPCDDAADANNDASLDIADAIKVLGYLFGGSGPLPDPFGTCGADPEEDALGCESYPPCEGAILEK